MKSTTKSLAIATYLLMLMGSLSSVAAPTSSPKPPAGLTVRAWSTVDFVDLVRQSKASCTVVNSLIQCSGRLQLDHLSYMRIRGNAAQLVFSNLEPAEGGLVLNGAANVTLSNLQIGWVSGGATDPSVPNALRIQSLGKVVACSNAQSGGALATDLPLQGSMPLAAVSVWDDVLGWPWAAGAPNIEEVFLPSGSSVRFASGRSSCVSQLAPLVGRRVLVRHIIMASHAFDCLNCQNVTVEGVNVTSAPGMAFVFENGGSHLTLRNNSVAPACAPSCKAAEPSVTSDAAHFAAVGSDLDVEGNDFGWNGDDSLNVTGLMMPATLEASGHSPWLQIDPQWAARVSQLSVGCKVLIFDQGLALQGSSSVVGVDENNARVQLAAVPPTMSEFVLVRTDRMPANITVRGNHFHDHRARGILMGGSDSRIIGNVIERVTMEAILVDADSDQWYEGPGAQHVVISGNEISNVNRYPDMANYPSAISAAVVMPRGYTGPVGTPIQDVQVSGNTFLDVLTGAAAPTFFGEGVAAQANQVAAEVNQEK